MDFQLIIDAAFSAAFGPEAIVLALAAIGLNIHFGYTGLLNFGQAGFMAVGAYGLAVSVITFGLPFWVCRGARSPKSSASERLASMTIAMMAPIFLAILLGFPTLRLRADYLAIVTIAAAEILRLVFGSVELVDTFGGSNGLTGFAKPYQDLNPFTQGIDLGFISFSRSVLWSTVVGWTLVLICVLITWLLMRSPWGRVLRSIREDEDAVRSLGKNVFAYKMQALILGGVFGGVAGLYLALKQASVVPSDYSTNITFFAYTALLLGGAARVWGPVVGAMIFWFLMSGVGAILGQLTGGPNPILPSWILTSTESSLVRFILVGVGLMLLMIFRPQGIFGDRREIAIDAR